ncbi:serine/threonine protein kinase [Labilithrix luteola]|uniref:Serine/threonine protein kinase n=1 Tax=Labilithrix luteola TaxID=1391654 RepID=A0A0K1PKZ4_9BACT|nr:serine/threonine-protein kinase [Labilithrix luteola]AKU94200.1 serine/threonine protein kinase [Labilithrix luteola]
MNEAVALASKVCTACGARYPGDALFCPADGTPLQSARTASQDTEDDPYLGQELSGHIEIRQLIGIGAMGRVYRAFQKGIDRDVAVKVLHRELSANNQLVSRFTREAKVASRLSHPNVVQVLLAGQLPDRALYMVMEYLDGLSLQSALAAAGGAMPMSRALHIGLQLCEAAGEAHAQGIVHRDLKPENVMLVRRGVDEDFVKVLDFGIARINWGEQSVATQAGLIFGTARYISPEGAQGTVVGPPSDVYSIATLFYQMLSGRTPFDSDQAVGLLVAQIHDAPPSLRSIGRSAYVPQPICDVIMANLAKDPKARAQDARSFGHAIVDAARQAGLAPDDISRPILHRRPSVMQLPPTERTQAHELTPELAMRLAPPSLAPVNSPTRVEPRPSPTGPQMAATAKWEPPEEFQARLAGLSNPSGSPSPHPNTRTVIEEPARPSGILHLAPNSRNVAFENRGSGSTEITDPPPVRTRTPSSVDTTLDDASSEPVMYPAFPPPPSSVPKHTAPGDRPAPTHYAAPLPSATPLPVAPRSEESLPITRPRTQPPQTLAPSVPPGPRRTRAVLFVVLCFVLGAGLAAVIAWRMGRLGTDDGATEDRYVARATEAMFKNRFVEPPGENVRDITSEGLKRWPNAPRLLDVRMRAANELVTQAIAQRAAGDVAEALRIAKSAHELDPNDASSKRLVDQYEGELANFAASSAPPLKPAPPVNGKVPSVAASPVVPVNGAYKVLLDLNIAQPRIGQTVEFTARIAPAKGTFEEPVFIITGPGIAGVRMPAQAVQPGVYKGAYAFLEGGKFEIVFSTQADHKPLRATRSLVAGDAPAPKPPAEAPAPTTPPAAPAPTPSVKWM